MIVVAAAWLAVGCTSAAQDDMPEQHRGPAVAAPRIDGKRVPTGDDEVTAPPGEGAHTPTRLGPPDTVVLQIYAVADEIADPFAEASGPAPRGVQVMTRTRKGEGSRQVAHVNRIPGEPVRTTLQRARPWFAAVDVPEGHRFLFTLVTGFEHHEDVDAVLVEPDPIEVRLDQTVLRAPIDDDWIRVELTEPACLQLTKLTTQLVGREVAFVVADRVLWEVRLDNPIGESSSQTLGLVKDPAVAEKVRLALRGDADARKALAQDTITDGGSWDDVMAKREADKLPDPVAEADGTTTFFVESDHDGHRVKLRAKIPAGWPFATNSDDVMWNSSRSADANTRTIRVSGWTNDGGHLAHVRSISEDVVRLSESGKSFDVQDKTYRTVHEVLVDETTGPRRLFVRAVTHPDGVPPGLIFDRLEGYCWVTEVSDEYYLRAKMTGPTKKRTDVLKMMRDVCGSLSLTQ